MVISLIGYRGSGKSSVAPLLASSLGWEWFDADPLIEQAAGCTIREIFANHGEPHFREWERQVMAELLGQERIVIAAGGTARAELRHCAGCSPRQVPWSGCGHPSRRWKAGSTRTPRRHARRPALTNHTPGPPGNRGIVGSKGTALSPMPQHSSSTRTDGSRLPDCRTDSGFPPRRTSRHNRASTVWSNSSASIVSRGPGCF